MPAGALPGLEPIAADWVVFFAAVATAAATLAGLTFVAVSAHPPLLAEPRTRGRAQRSLVAFIVVLIAALTLTMPRQPMIVATNLMFWLALSGLYSVFTTIRRVGPAGTPLAWLRSAFDAPSLISLLIYALGAVWGGLHLPDAAEPPDLTDFAAGMVAWLAWAALQSWQVMLAGLQERLHSSADAASKPASAPVASRPRAGARRRALRRPRPSPDAHPRK